MILVEATEELRNFDVISFMSPFDVFTFDVSGFVETCSDVVAISGTGNGVTAFGFGVIGILRLLVVLPSGGENGDCIDTEILTGVEGFNGVLTRLGGRTLVVE